MFSWVSKFDLFLFDFDGLLVSTERLHYKAYIAAFKKMGFDLDWSFEKFTKLAHLHSNAFRAALYSQFPALHPEWEVTHAIKREEYIKLIEEGDVDLMPGVNDLLFELQKKNIRRCVATHSPKAQVELVKKRHLCLQTIPLWITREDYQNPKPSSDCYLQAIEKMGKKGDQMVGFEDSLRGYRALQGAPCLPVLICLNKDVPEVLQNEAIHFETFNDVQFS